jgi:hypothetical protein
MDLQIISKLAIRIDVPHTIITEFSAVSCGHWRRRVKQVD